MPPIGGRGDLMGQKTAGCQHGQQQIIHRTDSIGQDKVTSAKETLLKLNPDIEINCINRKPGSEELDSIVKTADVVIDATDNFEIRFAINLACVKNKTPLISGAAIRMEGQVSVFDLRNSDNPCYRCLYDEQGNNDETCSENGVMSPMVGIIGSIQAMEAIKIIADIGDTLTGKLLITDSLHQEWRTMKLKKDPDCPVCNIKN